MSHLYFSQKYNNCKIMVCKYKQNNNFTSFFKSYFRYWWLNLSPYNNLQNNDKSVNAFIFLLKIALYDFVLSSLTFTRSSLFCSICLSPAVSEQVLSLSFISVNQSTAACRASWCSWWSFTDFSDRCIWFWKGGDRYELRSFMHLNPWQIKCGQC